MSWTDEQKPHPYIKYTTVSVRRTLLKSSFKNLIGFFCRGTQDDAYFRAGPLKYVHMPL